MSSYQQLLAWIRVASLESSQPGDVLTLVEAALEELSESDERYDALLEIEDYLLDGETPRELLRALLPVSSDHDPKDDVARIEQEYRAVAAAYRPEQWQSNFYLDLEYHLEESEDEELREFAESLRDRLTSVWNKYLADYESLPSSTVETVVGHRLMKDGYESWMRALDLVEHGEADVEEVLAEAEMAVRLLVAMGQLDKDVKMQAGSLGAGGPTFQTGC